MAGVVFGIDLEPFGYTKQAELCRAVAQHTRVTCRSGHKTGKTCSVGLLAWWFAWTRPRSRVITTAPTERQVQEAIWREVSSMRERAIVRGYRFPDVPLLARTGIKLPNGSQILGFVAKDANAFSGISAPQVMYLVDEAAGVKQEIFEAILGNRAGGGKFVMTGNPTTTSGYFFDSQHDSRHLYGAVLHISSTESPNIVHRKTLVPGLAEYEWHEETLAETGGPGNPLYDVRCAGNFPRSGPNVVIPLHLVEAARERYHDGQRDSNASPRLGVDVARFGDDDTVIAFARGREGAILHTIHGHSTDEVAGAVVLEARNFPGEQLTISIDEGGVGAGVVDMVSAVFANNDNVTVVGVNAGSVATNQEKFDRRRDELAWAVRDWLAADGILKPNRELERELVAATYKLTQTGKIKIEPKDELKKRLKRSPDHADALALAVADETTDDLGPLGGIVTSDWIDGDDDDWEDDD